MLYDAFICHASEDRDDFVRPLAEALQSQNVAVWYDEFTLKLGDSIRRSLDKGLKQCRFGVVVLSRAFFQKGWPQYELDGLAEREMKGRDKVVLPVWHGVTHQDIMEYSPTLAGRKAVSSSEGLEKVVGEIVYVVHPQHSPLIVARDTLLEWGLTPPVITDQYWLKVVEASNRIPGFGAMIPEESTWYGWSFPLPQKSESAQAWGERLAWTAMQMNWVKTSEAVPISPLTPPREVLSFIDEHPGLLEICESFLSLTAEYAPQLTIPGMGGPLEASFEDEYQKSLAEHTAKRAASSREGSALTTNKKCPLCAEEWALRHPTFGDYGAVHIAEAYFKGGMFGPQVSPYHGFDHTVWLLSDASSWLPAETRSFLRQGMKDWISWHWGPDTSGTDSGGSWKSYGSLFNQLRRAIDSKKPFRWTDGARDDSYHRIKQSVEELSLTEPPEELLDLFVCEEFPEHYVAAERKLRSQRAAMPKKRKKQANKRAKRTD